MNKGNAPTVSVIIPTYNRAHLVSRAIWSVLRQTYSDFEIIVVDDASSDNTEEVVKSFNDLRIRYIHHKENRGGSAARNTGILVARGEYIAFLDSDDEWLPEYLEEQLKVLTESDAHTAVCYTGLIRRREREKEEVVIPEKHGDIHYYQLWKDYVSSTSAVVVKRNSFNSIGFFNEKLPARQDYEMWLRLSKKYYFDYIRKPLVIVYDYSAKRIASNLQAQKEGERLIREFIRSELGSLPFSRRTKQQILAYHYFLAGRYLANTFGVKEGRSEFVQATLLWPFSLLHWIYLFVSLLGNHFYSVLVRIGRWFRQYFGLAS